MLIPLLMNYIRKAQILFLVVWYSAGRLRKNEVVYVDDSGRKFSVLTFPSKSGRPFLKAVADGVSDVTSRIKQVAGPRRDFHGIKTTPSLLGFESLEIGDKKYARD